MFNNDTPGTVPNGARPHKVPSSALRYEDVEKGYRPAGGPVPRPQIKGKEKISHVRFIEKFHEKKCFARFIRRLCYTMGS